MSKNETGYYSFRISGAVYHQYKGYQADEKENANFAQIYIYDPATQLEIRNNRYPDLNYAILSKLQAILHTHNPYVQLFQQLRILIENKPQSNYVIKLLDNYAIDKRLNTPSVDEIACLMLSNDNVATSNTREVII